MKSFTESFTVRKNKEIKDIKKTDCRKQSVDLISLSLVAGTGLPSTLVYREFVGRVEKILEKEIANENLNVKLLASEMYMGLSTFHNKFLSVTGNTPNVFIIKYKMRKTVELLKNSNKTITEISEMLGFKSVSYFSTAFKKENGISPSEFLKVNRR